MIDMRVLHLTTRALDELSEQGREPAKELNEKFTQYDRARLCFDSAVVQNLHLDTEPHHLNPQQFNYADHKSPDSCAYRLFLSTVSGKVHVVYFEKHYLKAKETIFVKTLPQDLCRVFAENTQSTIKSFEMVCMPETEIFIVGTSEYVKNSDQRANDVQAACDRSLSFIYSNREGSHL